MDWLRKSRLAARCLSGAVTMTRGPLALRITPRGLAALGVEKASALPDAPPLSGKTAEDGEPTPDAPSQRTSAVHKAAPNRRAAAARKRSSDELGNSRQSPARVFPSNLA